MTPTTKPLVLVWTKLNGPYYVCIYQSGWGMEEEEEEIDSYHHIEIVRRLRYQTEDDFILAIERAIKRTLKNAVYKIHVIHDPNN